VPPTLNETCTVVGDEAPIAGATGPEVTTPDFWLEGVGLRFEVAGAGVVCGVVTAGLGDIVVEVNPSTCDLAGVVWSDNPDR